ncbi:hypothetical protein ABFA07_016567 [Porites harrisoni]
MSVTSSQAKTSPVYSKAQTVKINSRYKGKSIADCFDFLQLICPLGSFPMYELYDILICRTLGRFLSLESQNQVCLLLEVGGRQKCNVNLVKWIKKAPWIQQSKEVCDYRLWLHTGGEMS